MIGLLAQAGYQVDSNEELADYVVVNTCSFIQASTRVVRTLVELAEANKKVVITGCMAQHFQQELLDELPEAVAQLSGTGDYHKIVDVMQQVEKGDRVSLVSSEPTYIADETTPRYRTTSEGVAYLRIAEGCDYRCAFCIIPHLRGNQRSRTIEVSSRKLSNWRRKG